MHYRQPFSGEYPITQRFGETVTDPKGHTGIDYACPVGTSVLASAGGQVIFAGWDKTGYGNCVMIRHKDGNATLYAHLASIANLLAVGHNVIQGEAIGYSGSTGNSTGPHLHFEARDPKGKPFDPMELPLMSVDDNIANTSHLKEPDQLGELVKVVCTDGANAFKPDWTYKPYGFPQGTPLHFTGRTTERLGYTYCEVYPEPVKYWVAVHDGTTQILDDLA